MSTETAVQSARRVRSVPMHRAVPGMVREPAAALAEFAQEAGGEIVRLGLGPFRPYLVTHPDHVQHVLRGDWTNYRREGMFWRPLERFVGTGIFGEGESWEDSRKILQPLFTTRYVATLAEEMARAVTARVGELDEHARTGRPVDAAEAMTGIVNHAVVSVLFGDKIAREDSERLTPAYETANASIKFRLLMPFMPYFVRLPGDRALVGAAKAVDDIVFPLIQRARANPDDSFDVISVLCRSRGDGDDRRIRDDLVGVYGAASETTAMTLTWLWCMLDAHPEVAAKVNDEIAQVVGDGPVTPAHVPRLSYTRMVLQEVLRLYPAGWITSRTVMRTAEVGGVQIKAGSQILISPYATHRLEGFWERPLEFNPERFVPEKHKHRNKYSYFPFGAGPHQCLGQHLFYVQAPLMVAAVLSRFRVSVCAPGPFVSDKAATLRPARRIELSLARVGRAPGQTR
ncbi:cytochrome P450 [Streptosporangium canum]|uniref:cytochrome P450 n=1 Tax=Streptosporangium canum TaxID=324952 RepID=UPI0036948C14